MGIWKVYDAWVRFTAFPWVFFFDALDSSSFSARFCFHLVKALTAPGGANGAFTPASKRLSRFIFGGASGGAASNAPSSSAAAAASSGAPALDVLDNAGDTALHLSAIGGHIECVDLLLNAGASPAVQDAQGRSLLHIAAQRGMTRLVGTLLSTHRSIVDTVDVKVRTSCANNIA